MSESAAVLDPYTTSWTARPDHKIHGSGHGLDHYTVNDFDVGSASGGIGGLGDLGVGMFRESRIEFGGPESGPAVIRASASYLPTTANATAMSSSSRGASGRTFPSQAMVLPDRTNYQPTSSTRSAALHQSFLPHHFHSRKHRPPTAQHHTSHHRSYQRRWPVNAELAVERLRPGFALTTQAHAQSQHEASLTRTTNIVNTTGASTFPGVTSSHRDSHYHQIQRQNPKKTKTSFPRSARKMHSIQTENELAHLQKLSNEYEPAVEGPLVGDLQSSENITAEYAHADPVYVQKTIALPHKYSHYRTVKGDGNCGWRAIAFGYFEALERIGDEARILEEATRLTSLNNLLNTAGFSTDIYIDFVEETIELLKLLAESTATNGGKLLLEKFNDVGASSAIITHFRLLTSAWMKTRPDLYQPFILDGTLDQYCATQIEPYQVEIEHIGMNAIIDVLVKPAGLAVEILYLDRSAGTEVNEHRFEPAGATDLAGSETATLRLLYRPGHYDLLYKAQDLTPSAITQSSQVYLGSFSDVSAQELPLNPTGRGVAPYLASVPGMSYVGLSGGVVIPQDLSPISTMPVSPVSPVFPSHLPMGSRSTADINGGPGSFRHSKYEYEEFFLSPRQDMPFQTATFRNSHFNPAHFRNSEFQPELWSPGSEECRK